MTILLLVLASFIAWFISSLAGGGSPFIIIPMVNFLVGTVSRLAPGSFRFGGRTLSG